MPESEKDPDGVRGGEGRDGMGYGKKLIEVSLVVIPPNPLSISDTSTVCVSLVCTSLYQDGYVELESSSRGVGVVCEFDGRATAGRGTGYLGEPDSGAARAGEPERDDGAEPDAVGVWDEDDCVLWVPTGAAHVHGGLCGVGDVYQYLVFLAGHSDASPGVPLGAGGGLGAGGAADDSRVLSGVGLDG